MRAEDILETGKQNMMKPMDSKFCVIRMTRVSAQKKRETYKNWRPKTGGDIYAGLGHMVKRKRGTFHSNRRKEVIYDTDLYSRMGEGIEKFL